MNQFKKCSEVRYIPSRLRLVSLKDLTRFWQKLARRYIVWKIFFQNLARSCTITIRLAKILQDNHSSCTYECKWNMIEIFIAA